jgi:hypothetical protein
MASEPEDAAKERRPRHVGPIRYPGMAVVEDAEGIRVEGYRVELPEERLTADFNDDSVLELSPDLVGPSITLNSGIIGQTADMSLQHLGDMRPSTLLFHLTQRLLYTKWRDPGEEPRLHLFGQLKRHRLSSITCQPYDPGLGVKIPALLIRELG